MNVQQEWNYLLTKRIAIELIECLIVMLENKELKGIKAKEAFKIYTAR